MDLGASPSVGSGLRALRAELGTLQAGQAAQLGRLQRALARARAEREAAAAVAGQQAAEAARLREEAAGLREEAAGLRAELRRGQELCARYQLEVAALRARRHGQHRGAAEEVAQLQEELEGLRAQEEAQGEQLRLCHHRCPQGPEDTEGPPPSPPHPQDPEDARSRCPEGTQSQEATGGLRPFLLFVMASTIIFLYPCLKQG